MFDTKEGNALQELSKNGASPNAFTSFHMTAYHFECTDKFADNLRILLSFVSEPYFTPESVAKEQGIIGQEIRMYEDSPDWRVFENLFLSLYQNHPIRINIAGTVESIAQITDRTLYDCHRAFYAPSNMVLCVSGDAEAQLVREIAQEILPKDPGSAAQRDYGPDEGVHAHSHDVSLKMEVSIPLFILGSKLSPAPLGQQSLLHELLGELSVEALCGASSPLYTELYNEGLINRSFEASYMAFPGGACLLFSGESRDPSAVRARIFAEAERAGREGFNGELFERLKKAAFGHRLRGLNSLDDICSRMAGAHFQGARYFDFPSVFDKITMQDAASFVAQAAAWRCSRLLRITARRTAPRLWRVIPSSPGRRCPIHSSGPAWLPRSAKRGLRKWRAHRARAPSCARLCRRTTADYADERRSEIDSGPEGERRRP
jgi:predicted Zn-dependent peptidase